MLSLASISARRRGGRRLCSLIQKIPLQPRFSQNQRISFATTVVGGQGQRFDSLFEDVPAEKQAEKAPAKLHILKPLRNISQQPQIPTTTAATTMATVDAEQISAALETKKQEPITPTWKGIRDRNEKLHQIMSTLQPISLPLLDVTQYNDLDLRKELFHATKELLAALQQAVQRGEIDPTGRKGREVSAVLANIMNLYSASFHCDEEHLVFEECSRVLSLLDMWNLSRQGPHYHYSILAAVQEQRWNEAADLFMQQIDGEVSGFSPVEVAVSSPFGLYAMARAAQENDTTVVEPVMNAAINLSLISPSDQDTYVLAAGTALGLAGEWKALNEYLENSYNSTSLGQALVAATMHASILCNQHDEALRVFRTLVDGNLTISSEFQWGGNQHQVSPLCRDLAMRAMGNSVQSGLSAQALEFFEQTVKDELAISDDALLGVLGACEQDLNWQGSVEVLFSLLDDNNKSLWVVPGSELRIPDVPDMSLTVAGDENVTFASTGKVLSSVVRTCCASEQQGLAMLCYCLVDASSPGCLLYRRHEIEWDLVYGNLEQCGSIEQTLIPLLTQVDNSTELLAAMMIALCGLGCHEEAVTLHDCMKNHGNEAATRETFLDTEHIYGFAQYHIESSAFTQRRWDSAHRSIHRIVKTIQAIKTTKDTLTQDQLQIITNGLSGTLRSCTFSGYPNAGILLLGHVKNEVSQLQSQPHDHTSIFGGTSTSAPVHDLVVTDSLLSEQMKAYQAMDQREEAVALFQSFVNTEDQDEIGMWPQSCNSAMSILSQNEQLEEAVVLFRRVIKTSGNMDSYLEAAKIFAEAERWNDVGDVYHMAVSNGCISEQLGILALKAVNEMDMSGKLRVLRGIINDTAEAAGTTPMNWLESHYWTLNRLLGFSLTRLLMWWNDPHTSHIDELQFAIDVFEKRLQEGLRPKHAAVRIIVHQARQFREGHFPRDKKGVARVPRDRESWANLLRRVLEESQTLKNDARFIGDAAMALRHLECNHECVEWVQEALKRGVRVQRHGLIEAVKAAEACGMKEELSQFRLMLT